MTSLLPSSIARVLDRGLATAPDGEALVARSGRLSYRELDAAADRVGRALVRDGVKPGDVIGVSLPNDLDIVVAFHAAMRLGAVWVGVNRALAPAEKRYILDDADVTIVLADPEMAEQVVAGGGAPARREIVTVEPADLAWARGRWLDPGGSSALAGFSAAVDAFAPAAFAYTSGTTGRPKGVVHSQHNLLLPGAVLVDSRGYGPDLRKGDCLALTILNMLVLTTLLTAQCAGTCVVMDRLDPRGIADWIRDERIGTWNGVPALLSALCAEPSVTRPDLATLTEVWTGGDSCPPTIAERFAAKFGIGLTSTYGLTEAPTVVSMDPVDAPSSTGRAGTPLPHLRVTIRDDDDRPVPVGDVGEVCVEAVDRGAWTGMYRPMHGYHRHADAAATALRGGRLHTGDVGSLDDDGYLTIRSRRSALIIRGGANVYPAEVERVIAAIPGVAGCVVYGLDDERLGQRVAAAIEVADGSPESPGPDDVIAACAEQLARYKVPDQVLVVDRLPRNSMGKVDRSGLVHLRPRS